MGGRTQAVPLKVPDTFAAVNTMNAPLTWPFGPPPGAFTGVSGELEVRA